MLIHHIHDTIVFLLDYYHKIEIALIISSSFFPYARVASRPWKSIAIALTECEQTVYSSSKCFVIITSTALCPTCVFIFSYL